MTTLSTERLILRPWTLDDFEAFAAMSAEPEVMQFISKDGRPLTRFQAWQGFSATVGHWQLRGFGMFAVIERASGELVGRIGPWHPEGWPGLEVGWSLRSKYWGRGYATEAAAASMNFAFDELRQDKVISLIDEANVRSIAVAMRLGETVECDITLPTLPDRRILQYRISKNDWKKQQADR
jgi:RimJ/RimL family protein N-acetyltransferase